MCYMIDILLHTLRIKSEAAHHVSIHRFDSIPFHWCSWFLCSVRSLEFNSVFRVRKRENRWFHRAPFHRSCVSQKRKKRNGKNSCLSLSFAFSIRRLLFFKPIISILWPISVKYISRNQEIERLVSTATTLHFTKARKPLSRGNKCAKEWLKSQIFLHHDALSNIPAITAPEVWLPEESLFLSLRYRYWERHKDHPWHSS